jgi:putative transposase
MPRQVRIEYPGAIYHCMARGDRREAIVLDDEDRGRFRKLLGELVQQTGWEVFAWVLMTNHYHLVFKTPEPNLVIGMKWLQNTWTKRFNARHGMWGHVYGSRYKAVLVEENEHLSCLIDYVHLNPFRAGMVNLEDGIEQYDWSSLGDYLAPPRQRAGWVQVSRGLEQKEIRSDTAKNRRQYLEHLEAIAREHGGVPELPGDGERNLQSTLRRGWMFGGEAFREGLIKRLDKLKGGAEAKRRRRSGYTGVQTKDHGEAPALRLVTLGLSLVGLEKKDLKSLRKNDWRKRVIGRAVRRNTTVPAAWISEQLRMGNVVRCPP